MHVYSFTHTQIKHSKFINIFITIVNNYINFRNIFSYYMMTLIEKYIEVKDHGIDSINNLHLAHVYIHSLRTI